MLSTNDLHTLAIELIQQCIACSDIDESNIFRESIHGTLPTNPRPRVTRVIKTGYRHPKTVSLFDLSKFELLLDELNEKRGLCYTRPDPSKDMFACENGDARHEIDTKL